MSHHELKKKIFAADDRGLVQVPTPEWPEVDGQVYVRVMSGSRRDQWEGLCSDRRELSAVERNAQIRAIFAALVACDRDGKYLFDAGDEDELAQLGEKSYLALDRLYDEGARVNRLRKEDLEQIEKNSAGSQNASSGCDSASPTASPSADCKPSSTAPHSPS